MNTAAAQFVGDFLKVMSGALRAVRPYRTAMLHDTRAISAATKHLPTHNQVTAALDAPPLTNTNPPGFDAAQQSARLSSLGVPVRLVNPYVSAALRVNAAAWKVLPKLYQPLAGDVTTLLNDMVQAGELNPGDPLCQQGTSVIADIQSGNYLALSKLSNNI